jgi:hypothetical protein
MGFMLMFDDLFFLSIDLRFVFQKELENKGSLVWAMSNIIRFKTLKNPHISLKSFENDSVSLLASLNCGTFVSIIGENWKYTYFNVFCYFYRLTLYDISDVSRYWSESWSDF